MGVCAGWVCWQGFVGCIVVQMFCICSLPQCKCICVDLVMSPWIISGRFLCAPHMYSFVCSWNWVMPIVFCVCFRWLCTMNWKVGLRPSAISTWFSQSSSVLPTSRPTWRWPSCRPRRSRKTLWKISSTVSASNSVESHRMRSWVLVYNQQSECLVFAEYFYLCMIQKMSVFSFFKYWKWNSFFVIVCTEMEVVYKWWLFCV